MLHWASGESHVDVFGERSRRPGRHRTEADRATGKVSLMIMLTGGAGYIGSHVCVALLDAGLGVVAVDNLSNSSKASLERVHRYEIAPDSPSARLKFSTVSCEGMPIK